MYLINPSDDVQQVSGGAITSTSTVVDGGAALGVGSNTGSPITASVDLGHTGTIHGSQVIKSQNVWGVLEETGIALTSVASTSGKCRFTLNSHGLTVGTKIMIKSGIVNGVHKITNLSDANHFDTDRTYAAGTAGTYYTLDGTFATMTVRNYIMRGGVDNSIASTGLNFGGFGSDFGIRNSIHRMLHMRTTRTATAIRAGYWNIYSGRFTTAPGDFEDISAFGTDQAATVTRAAPGELVYRVSGQANLTGITQDDYPAKTQ